MDVIECEIRYLFEDLKMAILNGGPVGYIIHQIDLRYEDLDLIRYNIDSYNQWQMHLAELEAQHMEAQHMEEYLMKKYNDERGFVEEDIVEYESEPELEFEEIVEYESESECEEIVEPESEPEVEYESEAESVEPECEEISEAESETEIKPQVLEIDHEEIVEESVEPQVLEIETQPLEIKNKKIKKEKKKNKNKIIEERNEEFLNSKEFKIMADPVQLGCRTIINLLMQNRYEDYKNSPAEIRLLRAIRTIEKAFINRLINKGKGKYKYYKLINDLIWKKKVKMIQQRYLNILFVSKQIYVNGVGMLTDKIKDLIYEHEYLKLKHPDLMKKKQNARLSKLVGKISDDRTFDIKIITKIVTTIDSSKTDFKTLLHICGILQGVFIKICVASETCEKYRKLLSKEIRVIADMCDDIYNYNRKCDMFNRPTLKCNYTGIKVATKILATETQKKMEAINFDIDRLIR